MCTFPGAIPFCFFLLAKTKKTHKITLQFKSSYLFFELNNEEEDIVYQLAEQSTPPTQTYVLT